jgi:hypothetical protein
MTRIHGTRITGSTRTKRRLKLEVRRKDVQVFREKMGDTNGSKPSIIKGKQNC